METNQLVIWMFGSSIGGFLFLAGWCWNLHEKYNAIAGTAGKVNEIHTALLGDLESEGLVSKTRRIEESCRRNHLEGRK